MDRGERDATGGSDADHAGRSAGVLCRRRAGEPRASGAARRVRRGPADPRAPGLRFVRPEQPLPRLRQRAGFRTGSRGLVHLGERAQAGLVLPLLETRRFESGIPTWGSGVGDLAVGGRCDLLLATEALYWPGIGLLVNVVVPTGKAAGEGTNAASTDATGTGTYNADDRHRPREGAWAALLRAQRLGHLRLEPDSAPARLPCADDGLSLQWTLLGAAGYVFESEAAQSGPT